MPGSPLRRIVGRVAVAALAVAVPVALSPALASATPTELFISEYIEGSSNNKALEIFNGTGAAVDLGGGGLRHPDVLQRQREWRVSPSRSPARWPRGTCSSQLAQSSADPLILAEADQTNGAGVVQRR